ncbi:3-deoxy-D-manno-octulosonic acid transferase [Pantoea sp. Aalb]|nr:3-deoxy-D-manno-octulosonic acid transferase [Pantoea sp. Aalb]
MMFLYTLLLYLIQPLIWIYLLIRSIKEPSYRKRWFERYGYCMTKIKPHGILLHAVSVGETLTAIPLIRSLRHYYPNLPITVTTMTPTGSEQVTSILGKEVYHSYLPYDLPGSIHRFLNIVQPILVIILETELWPNIIYILHHHKIPLIIANTRLSKRSARKYKKLGIFMRNLLQRITMIAAQSVEDGHHFLNLGLKNTHLKVIGSLKFDINITPELINKTMKLRYQWASHRLVWIVTSTHEGEEAIVLSVYQSLLLKFPHLLLVLVPRHPQRFKKVFNLTYKLGFEVILRSSGKIPSSTTQVVIVDSIGELMLLYGIADLAFIGGSLVKCGGHNPLEAAVYSIPILTGPYIWNFKNICSKLYQGKGLIIVKDKKSLEKEITTLLENKNYRNQYGYNAALILYQNQGTLQRLLQLLEPYLPPRA